MKKTLTRIILITISFCLLNGCALRAAKKISDEINSPSSNQSSSTQTSTSSSTSSSH